MDVGVLFIADPQPAELVESCECPLHNPPPTPEPAAVRSVALSQQRLDALCTQPRPDLFGIISAVPSTQSGRQRGLPRGPCKGGMASTNAKASCESLRLAPVNLIASGIP
jgi:hypothetical protein